MRRDDFALCRAQILIDRDKLDAVNDDTIPLQMLQIAGLAVDIKRIHQFERIGSVILLDEFLNTCVNIVLFHFVLYLLIANNCSKNGFRDSKNDEKSYSPIIIIQKQMCHKTDTALTCPLFL